MLFQKSFIQVITIAELRKTRISLSLLIVMVRIVIMNGLQMKTTHLDDVSRILRLMVNALSMLFEIILFGVILSFIKN